ncbi:hypothetical protein GlitD10_2396 [Gloeomargarita lithophora Alchichica-D10]|uniref:Uncharacterized protein n=1 Tax=Gloeomargarita lithophora Alchichica-D10 TaxID=1188229 RepID=A0A1J0AFL9_9CYAN|nr:hypothetical protein [Gloeomargarita lithophora]APB34730.1 hypothetical protein GlitD10_2396 [Gloeomargarita lithophora Alchichica-D10]
MTPTINCAEACVNGCSLGEACPHRGHLAQALKFMAETDLDQLVEVAQASAPQRMLRQLEKGNLPGYPQS